MWTAKRLTVAAAVFLLAACGADEGAQADRRADWAPEVTAGIDSGNAAYRAGDYPEARRHFRAAAAADPAAATAWFGVYMAEEAMGNTAAADSALERVGELAETARMHHGVPDRADAPSRSPPAYGEPGSPTYREPSPRHGDPGVDPPPEPEAEERHEPDR